VHESPLSMTGVLMLLAVLSQIGGFIAVRISWSRNCTASVHAELHHYRDAVAVLSVVLALPAWPVPRSSSVLHRVVPNGCNDASPGCTVGCRGSISSTSCTNGHRSTAGLGVRIASFLRLGDRQLLDGTLNGLAAMGQRNAGRLSGCRPAACTCRVVRADGHRRRRCCGAGAMSNAFVLNLGAVPAADRRRAAGGVAHRARRLHAPADAGVDDRAVPALRLAFTRRFTAAWPGCNSRPACPWIASWGVNYQIGLDGYNSCWS